MSAAFDLMDARIHDVIRRQAMTAFKDVRVVPAGLTTNSGLIGAATWALDDVFGWTEWAR